MTVKELIEELSKVDGNIDVVITSTDPGDYTYINDIVYVQGGYMLGSDGEYYISDIADYSEEVGKSVFVIDSGDA